MNLTRREAILGLGAAGALAASSVSAEAGRVIIEGVDRYRVTEPVFEGVRVVLAKRGESYTPAYIQGISGAAFRVAGPCPCAPTCSCAMGPDALIRMLGYECEPVAFAEGADPKRRVEEVLTRVREEVRNGRPVLVFHAFTNAEWDVVCGYDKGTRELYGRGSYAGMKEYARAADTRMVTCTSICPIGGALVIGKKTGALDARAAETSALREAVLFARSRRADYPFPGLQCYDRWIDLYSIEPPRKPDYGADGYTSSIYASTQRAAAAFLREIRPRYEAASGYLEAAGRGFDREAASLGDLHALLFPREKGPTLEPRTLCKRASMLLESARAAYAEAIDSLAAALRALELA